MVLRPLCLLLHEGSLLGLTLRVSNEGSPRPRVARAQKIISFHPLPSLRHLILPLVLLYSKGYQLGHVPCSDHSRRLP